MIRKFAQFVIRFRLLLLVIMIAVTGFFVYHALKIVIKTNYDDQLPTNHPFRAIHEKYKEKLGGSHMVMLMLKVKEGDIFTIPTLKKIERAQYFLDSLPGVNHYQVLSLSSPKVKQVVVGAGSGLILMAVMRDVPKNEAEIGILKKTVHANENVFGPLVSFDDKCALITANFLEGQFDYDHVFSKVNELVKELADENTEVYAAGEPMLTGWIFHYRIESVNILLFTVAVMFILLFLYFRNLAGMVIPMLTGFISAIWGLGFAGALGYSLDPVILVIPLLVTAMTMTHSVQMCERYFELCDELGDKKKACTYVIESILPPGMLSLITDIAGIFLISIAPIPLLQKMAFFCSFWLMSVILSAMILNPIFFYYFPLPRNIAAIVRPERENILLRSFLFGLGNLTTGKRGSLAVVIGLAIVAVGSGIVASRLEIGDLHPGSPLLKPDSIYNIGVQNINQNFAGTDELFFIVEGSEPGLIRFPEIQQKMRECQLFMEASPAVGGSQSFADYAPVVNKFLHSGDPLWEVVPLDPYMMGSIMNIIISGASTGDFDRMMSRDHKDANIVIWCKDHKGDTIREVIKRAREWIELNKTYEKIKFRLASGYLGILAAVNETVTAAQAQNMALILGFTMLTSMITYRSIVAALILLCPLLLANFLTMVVMVMNQISLNVNTIPVASIGIGVGVDYSVYVLSRICEEFMHYRDYKTAIQTALKTTGKAVVFTATTAVGGIFLWFFLSSMRFQAEMGLLLSLLLLINMVLSLLLIPALVYVFKPKFVGWASLFVREEE